MRTALAAYLAVGVVMMLITPESALSSVPGIGVLAHWFEVLIPGIGRLSRVSTFPDAMKVTLVVLWIGLPFAALRIHRAWTFTPGLFALKKSSLWFVVLAIWVIAAILILPLYLFFEISRADVVGAGGRGGLLLSMLTQSRWSAALVAPVWFCAAAMCLGIATSLTARAASAKRQLPNT